MNYWYVARANELFIDTDNISKSLHHTKARLQGAIEYGRLDVSYVMKHISRNKNHMHAIVVLGKQLPNVDRFAWEVILHGDIYRACCNIMRWSHGVEACDILISPYPKFVFNEHRRFADDCCSCATKHNRATMETCDAAIRLRGNNRNLGFFGKPSKNPCTVWPDA